MCGICGVWGLNDTRILRAFMDKMQHRGPDAMGMHVHDNISLGHCRLSIMDPQFGDQPIYNEDETKVIIANGEIYNFPAMYEQLSQNHTFRTKNDSEAILHAYEEQGPDMVAGLDGMFGFCIADEDSLFLARDPIGIKPLYYAEDEKGNFYFSSELKTFYHLHADVKEFPAGSYYHSRSGFHSFYHVPDLKAGTKDVDFYISQLRETLIASVEKRMMSDVPVGAFLSGGLDSSLIAALARRCVDQLHTFSVGMEGSRDLAAARKVAGHIDSIHHEYVMTRDEIMEKLPEIIYHLESFDQDLVRSAIPCYFTSRLASEYVKVILTGEGADELFGGYTYYKEIEDEDVLHRELRRSVASLHNINLQRVDRLTMAHSVEGRVPFLDTKMIELGLVIPTEWKVYGEPPVEKWILRKAFEGVIPDEILWRKKEQFDEGSGTVDLVTAVFDGDSRLVRHQDAPVHLRSEEEAFYYELFMDAFDNPEPMLANVGRWADRPL